MCALLLSVSARQNVQPAGKQRRIVNIQNIQKNELPLVYAAVLCYDTLRRCSILVGTAHSQVGPKNPMKGISMKSLVSAFYAQFRVDAGG